VREAVDFLRYYARQVREHFDNATHRAARPVVCISPWNFPLAIFMGQVSAALAAGNVGAGQAGGADAAGCGRSGSCLLWAAGIPRDAMQLLPGRGAVVGAKLVATRACRACSSPARPRWRASCKAAWPAG
jgi:RHH-type proline utilization regulon transcriptional repressor/proline dehydrogenase/delta 1-pyrroline-5-carboxylate dehydrogenase